MSPLSRTLPWRRSLPLLLAAATLQACPPPSGGSPPPPFAEQPVLVPPATGDPTGTAPTAGAPPMFTTTLKFRIPTGTGFDLSVDGWILREQNATQCGNDGCYAVLSRADDGAGQTTWIVQAWPQVPARRADRATYRIEGVSFNASATGSQLASAPLVLKVQQAANPVLGAPDPFATRGTPEWASNNGTEFLEFRTIGLSSPTDTQPYYQAVDPNNRRATLSAWKQLNGFGPDDTQDDASAVYFNAGDLQFGRSMHQKVQPNGDIAYYVSNYPTVEDAVRKTNLIATVAMECTPLETPGGPPAGPRVMKFFVFRADDRGVGDADLDGGGAKFVPNLCVVCHGLRKFTGAADLGARFLPFDLSSFQYSARAGRAGLEAQFKQLNLGIYQHGNLSAATRALIEAWYQDLGGPAGNTDAPVQRDDAVPANWGPAPEVYLNVIKPGCRSCHISREPPLSFGTLADFQTRESQAHDRICGDRTMPNARVTYQRFWLTYLPGSQTTNLATATLNAFPGLLASWNAAVPCPAP